MTDQSVPIVGLKGVTKNFGGLCAVNDFNGHLNKGEIIGIIGPNGAGKTTILNLISGVYPPSSGTIKFKDTDITNLPSHRINQLGISRTFQNIRLFHDLTVEQTVMTAYSGSAPYGPVAAVLSLPKVTRHEREIREKSRYWLRELDIADLAELNAQTLPYGVQRRVEIARAMATKPQVLLLDEPGAGMNQSEVIDLVSLIRRLHQNYDLSIILIDHRMDIIMNLCDLIYVQNFGINIAKGTPSEIQTNPLVINAYLGEDNRHAQN